MFSVSLMMMMMIMIIENRVAKGWKISGKFPWEVKLGNFGNIPNWKLSMGIMGIYGN